jgi:uncharacterized protein
MSRSVFDPGFEALPRELPIFPLTGVLLLPGSRLPLNIFEPRYLAMTRDALGGDRIIGMVQPQEGAGDAGEPATYRTGCAGRLTEFAETDDGRYIITLTGLLRFDIAAELPQDRPYRRVTADWRRYRGDLDEVAAPPLDRKRLMAALHPFFERHGIDADWAAIEKAPAERLVTTLAAACPFAPREKQALLEAADAAERAQLLIALIEMAVLAGDAPVAGARH